MRVPSRVAVYCGSSSRIPSRYLDFAREVGAALASKRITLVYGAGSSGLMGSVANGCLDAGGKVLGVIPTRIETAEVAHPNLSELIVVDSMHARKQLMVGLADAIVALPGGFGTLDELFEAVTWKQLGYHDKPVIVCDPFGYYEPLLAFVAKAEEERFLTAATRALLTMTRSVDELLSVLIDSAVTRPRIG